MINKKKVVLSVLCLMLLVFSVFSFSACKNEIENFNLSFKVNGETYQTITTSGDEAIAIPENPTKEGYTFDGWYWDKDVWSKPFTANSLMDAPISSDMSVYAKFSAIEYDITYENDGGTHSNPVSYTIEDSFALSAAEKIGYTFVGWYSDAAYTTKVESVSAGSKGAITLYAKFEINNYTISYGNTKDAENNNVTSYNVDTDTITLSDLSKTGYVFEGWYNGEEKVTEVAKGSTGDITLTAKWSVIGYEITYHNVDGATNSNSATYDVEDQPLALSDASKNGYRFLGWYTDAAFTNKVSEIAIGTTGDINLYAKWELIEYTATFMDGTTEVGKVVFTVETDSITEPAVPEHVGYTGAWESYTLGTESITVNAVYTLISYGITYNNVSGATNNNPATYDVEDQPLALVDASKDHYTFLGWYSDAAFTNKVTEISVGTTGDVVLYAKWEAIEYTATFMDGTTVVGTVKFTVETESITEPAVPNHVGYTGAWESYTLGTENITVNAVYDAIEYTATFKDGTTVVGTVKFTVESESITEPAVPEYVGYTGAWESYTLGTENITVNAVYDAIEYTATFKDGTTVVGTVKFTVETESITEPAVPNHTGYTGAWENYILGAENIDIDASYTTIAYTIRYENTKDAVHDNQTSYTIESESITLENLSKTGYVFEGWYDENDNQVTVISKGSLGNITLTAKWTTITYTITFLYDNAIGDYAEGATVKTTYTVEDEFEFATLVCKTVGYTFDGWFTEKNIGTGTKVIGVTKGTSGNITVYAQFGLEEYDITYNNVNGATNNNPTHYNAASEDFTIYPLTKEGYTFDGWFTNEECTTPANLTITKGSNGDITLYAKWTPITYTIEYVTYGGTATGNPKTYIITDNVTFNNATLSGYVFKGWYTAAEGGSKVTGISAGTTGNIILYAHWDYVSTITFNSNGGSVVAPISNVEGTTISAPVAPTKEHYTFAGWYSDAALKNAYSFTTQPAEDITLYAKWTPVVYEIEYVLNGGTNSENNVVEYTVEDKIELYAPSKVGYTFIGWFTDAEFTSSVVTELKVGTSGKITLYAHYSVNQYTISFESNGGTSVSAITQNYATSVTAPEAPSKNGYTFAGWYSNASLTSKYTFSTMPADNITLYAKWNLETYNITYNLNGGTNNSSNPATYTITSAKITLKAPTKTGYSFAGWYTDAECTEAITEIASGSYGVVELFAKWTATEYTITYVTTDGATHSNILTYTIETDLTTLADAALKGHAFGGWYTDDSYATAVTTVAGGEIGNKTVYAKFTANTYNVWLDGNEEASCVVSFNLNGAEGTIASQTVTPTATLKYPTVPTRAGYIFAGWYDNENCTGSLYDFTAVVTSDTTLYAKWVKVENATAIAINGSSNVTLNGKYEQLLMFVPLVSGNVTITASGSYDTFGVLYSSDMTALVQNDDGASDGSNFLIVYNVTAGETYYIGARAFSSTTTGTATVSIAGSATVLDGGYAITASKGSATYGQSFTLNVPEAREGYKFLGYADENGVMYTDATGASVKVWDKDSDTTLYSKWERTVYTVTFVTSGGTAIDSIELAYGERLDISKYVTTRNGYSFNGWYLDGEAFNATTMPDHNITLTAYWKTFALGTIKYDVDKLAISVDDEITADLFNAICLDTDGNLATFTVTVNGTQEAGETITVILVATSGGKTKQVTITGIKVYGEPTLTFDNNVDYFNIKDGLTASWFGASGTDSFGNATTIKVYVDGEYESGELVRVTIISIDAAGNETYGYIDNVKVYGLPQITYNENKTAISVTDTLSAELFGATATDSFGEAVAVIVSKYSGTISAGNTVTVRLSATDSKGNVTNVDIACLVYGAPTISNATNFDVKESDNITPELLGITAVDTYGKMLDIMLVITDGIQAAGTNITVTATVTDITNNVTTKDYTLKIYGTPTLDYNKEALKVTEDATVNKLSAVVNFELNGGTGNISSQTITMTDCIKYPSVIPTKNGYAFKGWYKDAECTELFDFGENLTCDITLFAGWEAMATSYYSRNYIDIYNKYNSSSNYYSLSTSGTSSSSCKYTYFTALNDGTYTLCFKNSNSSSSYGTYLYVYNATQGSVIKSNSRITSTSYTSISFTANAGDVIYIRNYRYNTSYSATFYMYVTGASLPIGNGYFKNPAAHILNATAADSFGNPLLVTAELISGSLEGGSYVSYRLVATDHLGNTQALDTDLIGVYDGNDIKLSYSAGMSDLIKLSSKGEEFDVKAIDSFGNLCLTRVEAIGSELAGGNIISIKLIATDKAGNEVESSIIENIKVFDIPTISYNQSIFEISENTLPQDLIFWATVKDSFGEELYVEYEVIGEQIGGNTVTIKLSATDDATNVFTDYIYNVKVYASPEISYNCKALNVYDSKNITPNLLGIVSKNTFGNSLDVSISLETGECVGGSYVTYKIVAVDHLGNRTAVVTEPIAIYDSPLITYNTGIDSISIYDNISSELFEINATDSFGNPCTITVKLQDGFDLKHGGKYVNFVVVASDNIVNCTSEIVIEGVALYDLPEIIYNHEFYTINNSTDINTLFTVKDSFGKELEATITVGDLIPGSIVTVTVVAQDTVGNKVVKYYPFAVEYELMYSVDLYVDGKLYDVQVFNDNYNYSLPIVEKAGYYFYGWANDTRILFTDSTGAGIKQLEQTNKLNAVFYPEGYTPITNEEELKNIDLTQNYILMADIDLKGAEWTPIGTFEGIFDGNGFSICNFVINEGIPGSNSGYVAEISCAGLFSVNKGTIKNLNVRNCEISSTCSPYSIGGIAATNYGLIQNCFVNIKILTHDSQYIGGITGFSWGDVVNCTVEIEMQSSGTNGQSYIGGVLGHGGSCNRVINCHASGYINVILTSSSSSPYNIFIGGIVGYCYYTNVSFSSSSVDVSSPDNGGGLVGYVYQGNILNCYATGDVNVNGYYCEGGGLVGEFFKGVIANSYATGNVTVIGTSSAYAGGLCGSASSTIISCFATGNVSAQTTNSTSAHVGGLVARGGTGCSNCYYYEGQTYYLNRNGTISTTPSSTVGQSISNQNLLTQSWYEQELWKAETQNWIFNGTYPEINREKANATIVITSKEDLLLLQGSVLTGNYELKNDIDMSGVEFVPIELLFGEFNGNGFAIKNITINSLNSEGKIGFISINAGNIHDLKLENISYTIDSSSMTHLGGMVGYNTGDIDKCSISGNMVVNGTTQTLYIGGMVGYNEWKNIWNSYSSVNITASMTSGTVYVGGMVGGTYGNNSGVVKYCYSTGDISVVTTTGKSYVGGFAGSHEWGEVSSCYAIGSVISTSTSGTVYVGGFCGYSDYGRFVDCYATGAAKGETSTTSYAGGFCGYQIAGSLTNVFATGDVVAKGNTNAYTGGLIAYGASSTMSSAGSSWVNEVSATNCYRSSSQKFTTNSSSSATNSLGTSKSLSTLKTPSFYTSTLTWTEEVWNFESGQFPTLK